MATPTAQETQARIDAANAALAGGWDDIETLPEFATFPSGSYLMVIDKMQLDGKEGHISVTCKMVAEIDVPDSSVIPVPPVDSLFYERFRFAYKGEANFKRVFAKAAQHLNLSPTEFIEQAEGLEFICDIKCRTDKEDATKHYNNLRSAVLEEMLAG